MSHFKFYSAYLKGIGTQKSEEKSLLLVSESCEKMTFRRAQYNMGAHV